MFDIIIGILAKYRTACLPASIVAGIRCIHPTAPAGFSLTRAVMG